LEADFFPPEGFDDTPPPSTNLLSGWGSHPGDPFLFPVHPPIILPRFSVLSTKLAFPRYFFLPDVSFFLFARLRREPPLSYERFRSHSKFCADLGSCRLTFQHFGFFNVFFFFKFSLRYYTQPRFTLQFFFPTGPF